MPPINFEDALRRRREAEERDAVARAADQEREAVRDRLYCAAESAIGASVEPYVSYSDGRDPREVRLGRFLALGKALVENKANRRLADLPFESDEHAVAAGILKAACAGAEDELARLLRDWVDGGARESRALMEDNLRRVCAQVCDPTPYGLEPSPEHSHPVQPDSATSKAPRATKPKVTVNMRMLNTSQTIPEAVGWSCEKWAEYLDCAKSTVVETPTWLEWEAARFQAKASRRKDRRRRPNKTNQWED